MNNIIHIIRHTARAATVLLLALLTAQTAAATRATPAAQDRIISQSSDENTTGGMKNLPVVLFIQSIGIKIERAIILNVFVVMSITLNTPRF